MSRCREKDESKFIAVAAEAPRVTSSADISRGGMNELRCDRNDDARLIDCDVRMLPIQCVCFGKWKNNGFRCTSCVVYFQIFFSLRRTKYHLHFLRVY